MSTESFEDWNLLKQNIEIAPRNKFIREGDVWFCSIGKNIGHEENGKNIFYERPVLIVRKFTTHYFWAVPLSSSMRNGPYSIVLEFQGVLRNTLLLHLRSFDSKRLQRYAGSVPRESLYKIKQEIVKLITN